MIRTLVHARLDSGHAEVGPTVVGSGGSRINAQAETGQPRPTGVRDPLPRARTMVPQRRPGTVHRRNLGGLVSTLRPPVAAVSAPAGYGKSTLLVEWARADPRPAAWISLQSGDNDPRALLRLVATALDGLSRVDPAVWNDLASPGVSVLGQVVPGLAASVLTAEPFLLLLDDLHEVDDQECRDALTLFIDYLPPGSTVAAASRGEVWLNLARHRASPRVARDRASGLGLRCRGGGRAVDRGRRRPDPRGGG